MKFGAVSLLLSAVALGAAVIAITRLPPEPPERAPARSDRVAELEREIVALKRKVTALEDARPAAARERGAVDGDAPPPAESVAAEGDALTAIVDDAVDKKTKRVLDELRVKANKKPPWKAFASVLEFSDKQRATTERVVVEGQRQVHAILDTPTTGGRNLMDELVEIAAKGLAEPGKDHGWGPWFARVTTEKIPGTDETYGARIEAVKKSMHAEFQRDWSKEQYREFTEWGVDPTEIENVPGSPNVQLWERIARRARELGAKVPD